MNALRKSFLASLAAALFLVPSAASAATPFITGAVSGYNGGVDDGWSASTGVTLGNVVTVARDSNNAITNLAFSLDDAQTITYAPASPSTSGGTADVVISNAVFTTAYEYPGVDAVGGTGSQAAICVAQISPDTEPSYYGWVGETSGSDLVWIKLAGANPPAERTPITITMSFDYTSAPTVTFKAGTQPLNSSGTTAIPLSDSTKTQVTAVSFSGQGSIAELAGETEAGAVEVSWYMDDGTTLVDKTEVAAGGHPTHSNVVKNATAQYTYAFEGWAATAGAAAADVIDLSAATVSAATSYYAVFTPTPVSYALTWNLDGGTIASAAGTYTAAGQVPYGTMLTSPTVTKTGYTFGGWSPAVDATMPAAAASYTATWTPNANTAYTVKHYQQALDGTYPSQQTDTDNLTGTTGDQTAAVAKSYTGFTAGAVTQTTIAADGSTVVTIQYARNSYQLTWTTDGDTLTGNYTSGLVLYGAPITAPNTPTKTGSSFKEWSPAVDATMPAEATTYTATWNANTFTVYWVVDGETVETDTGVAYNTQAHFDGADPTKTSSTTTDFIFSGWSDGSTTYAANALPAVTGNVTFTAQFSESPRAYTLGWAANGGMLSGEFTPAGSVANGASITAPTATRDGYTFGGWDPEFTGTMPAADTTYTAQWSQIPVLALAKPTISSTVLASGTAGATVKVAVDPAAVVTATNANVAFSVDGGVTNATFTSLPWNEAVDWMLRATGAADLPGRFYAKGESLWFNKATNELADVDDLAEGMKGVDMASTPSAAGQMVRIQTCLEIPEGAMEELPTGNDVGSARTGFAVAQLSGDTAPAFYAFNGSTWDKLSGAAPAANTTNDLLIVLDVAASTARYYVDGVALYKDNAGAHMYALAMKASETNAIHGIGFANADGVKAPVVAEYDVPFEAAVGDVPYAAAAAGASAVAKDGTETLQILANLDPGVEIDLASGQSVKVKAGTFTGLTVATSVSGKMVRSSEPDADGVVTYDLVDSEATIIWLAEDGETEIDRQTLAIGDVPVYAGGAEGTNKTATAQFSYTFAGWTAGGSSYAPGVALPPVVAGGATYTAAFTETLNSYEIKWADHSGTVKTETVVYGETPTAPSTTPAQYVEDGKIYTGTWPIPSTVTGPVTYNADYNEGVTASATVISVAQDGTETVEGTYATLAEAFAAAQDGQTVRLLADVALTDRLFVNAGATPAFAGTGNRYATTSEDKAVTLDLNGHDITSASNIALAGGSLNITNSSATAASIATTNAGLAPVEIRGTGDLASKRTLVVGEGVTLDGGEYGLNVFGSNDEQKNLIDVTVDGTVNGTLFVLGNLTNAENEIDIVVNGTVAAPAGSGDNVNVGIALNGCADVTVNKGASVSGDSGIEVRAGTLTVNGGTIEATADAYSYKANGSGSSVKGAAVAVSQHGTRKAVEVSLGGGTFTGPVAVAVVDPETGDPASVAVALTGGTFDGDVVVDASAASVGAIIPATVVVDGETVPNPARFSDADADGVPEDYKLVADGETGLYKIEAKVYVAEVDGQGYETLAEAFSAAEGGDTVKLLADIDLSSTVTIDKDVTVDLDGHDITATDCRAFHVTAGAFSIVDNSTGETKGTVSTVVTPGTALAKSSSVIRVGSNAAATSFTLGAGVTVSSDYCYGVTYFGTQPQTVVIDGTVAVTGEQAAISGNGSAGLAASTVTVNGTVSATQDYAIYNPQSGTTTINGTVTGLGGIEVKAGTVTVNSGATVTATATEQSHATNNDGTSTTGYAIAAVGNAGYANNATVNIAGGTINGLAITLAENGATEGGEVTATSNEIAVPAGYGWGVTATPGVYRLVDAGAAIWIGGAQGDWNVPGNWDIGFVPTKATVVTFTNDAQVGIASAWCKETVLVDADVTIVPASGASGPLLHFSGNEGRAVSGSGMLGVDYIGLFNDNKTGYLTISGLDVLNDVSLRGNQTNGVAASFEVVGKTTISANALVKTFDNATTKFQGGIEVAKGVTAKIKTNPNGGAQIGTGVTLVANDGAGAPTAIWLMKNEGNSRGASLVDGAKIVVDAAHDGTYYVKNAGTGALEGVYCDIYEATPKPTVVTVAATDATVTGVTAGQRFVPGDKFTVEVSGLAEGHEAVLVIKKHSDGSELVNTKALPYEYTTPDFDIDVVVTAVLKTFTVIWVVEGEVPVTNTVEYGTETATFKPGDPSKPASASAIYTFTGWSPEVAETVTADATYTAQFDTATPVAMIGDAYYASLAAAVAAVPADGTETIVMMLANEQINVVGSAVTIPATKNVVLDLNGFEVVGTASEGATSALITNKGTLTIRDSSAEGTGKLVSGATDTWIYGGDGNYAGSYASNTISNSGTLTVESGHIENVSTGSATYAIDNNSSGGNAIVNILGGTVKAHSVAIRQFANSTTLDNTVNVSGGTVEAGYSAIWIQLPGSDASKAMKSALNVTGGTLKGGAYAFYDYTFGNSFDSTQYTLSGGTFDGNVFSYGANVDISGGAFNGGVYIKQTNPSVVSISGGTFYDDCYTYGDNASTEYISGGVFANEPYPEDVVRGQAAVKDGDVWTIGEAIAEIGTVGYATLERAFAAAEDGDTVKLLDDVNLTDRLFVNAGATPAYAGSGNRYATTSEDKSVTLDLNGKNITSSSNIALAGGSLAIIGTGTIETTNAGLAPVEIRGTGDLASKRTLVVGEGVTLDGGEYGLNVFGSNDAQKNLIDVTVNGTVNGSLFVLGNLKNAENVIDIVVNGTVTAPAGTGNNVNVGIALNGNANVTVNDGANVSGDSGIEVRAGSLTVNGGTIAATAESYSYTANGSGSTTKGAAVAVAQHTTKLATSATLNGGTLSGVEQIGVTDVNGDMSGVTVLATEGYTQNSAIPEDYKWVETETAGTYTLAAKEYVAQVFAGETAGQKYESLAAALAAAGDGDTVKLLDDVSLTDRLFVNAGATPAYAGSNNRYATTSENKAVTLDLNGHDITSSSNIALAGGSLAITGTGTIATTNAGLAPVEIRGTGDLASKRTLTIGEDVTLDGGEYGLNVFGSNDAQKNLIDVTVDGTVNGSLFVLGNLKNTENEIDIVVNGKVTAPAGTGNNVNVGIALNGNANVTVNEGASVSGDSGIEVRAGSLTVNGGTITATADSYSYTANGSGSTTKGAAVAVAQHGTKLATSATLNGGTLSGVKAIGVTDVNNDLSGVTVLATQGFTENSAIPENSAWVETATQGVYELVPTFTVLWVVEGTTVETDENVPKGETPEYNGETPTKEPADGKTFEFLAWNPQPGPIAGDTTYTATFKESGAKASVIHVADGGATTNETFFADLAFAVAAAQGGDTVKLLEDAELASTIEIGKDLTIDLNGNDIAATDARALWVKSGDVELAGQGTVSATGNGLGETSSVIRVGDSGADAAKLTVGKDVTVSTDRSYAISAFGKNAGGIELVVNGTVTSTASGKADAAIAGNGNGGNSPTTITINEGAVVSSTNGAGIFKPDGGTLTIAGGSVTGPTALYVKSGVVNVTDGTLTATGAKAAYQTTGDGALSTGDAIVVDNCGYPNGAPIVTVSGGTIVSQNGRSVASYAKVGLDPVADIIPGTSAALFSDADADGVAEGYCLVETAAGSGLYQVATAKVSVISVADGSVEYYADLAAAVAAAQSGDTVKLLEDAALTATVGIAKDLVIDLNGKNITATDTRALWVKSGEVELAGQGTVSATGNGLGETSSVIRVGDSGADAAKLTVGKDVTVSTDRSYAISAFGKNAGGIELVVNGTVSSTASGKADAAIAGNGNGGNSPTTITINEGAVVSSTNGAGIFKPDGGTLTIAGGSVTGPTALYVKSGVVNVTDGTLTATGAKAAYQTTGDGALSTGDAIVVDNCGYPNGAPTVTVTGGTIVSQNGRSVASYAKVGLDPVADIIPGTSAAKFSDADADGVAEGYYLVAVEGTSSPVLYEVAPRTSVIGTVITVAEDAVYDGATQDANLALVVKPTADGTALVLGTDYVAVFATNALVNAGDYNVKVVGVGAWKDETNVTFKVAKRPATFTGASDTKVYDGTALVKNDFSTSNLVSGHEATATVAGSQTDVGVSSNVVSAAAVKDANDNDVTANYTFTYVDGELKVTPAAMAITIAGVDSTSVYTGAEQTTNVAWTATSETVGFVATKVSYTGDVSVAGTDVADYAYNLDATKFVYADDNFTATFTVDPDGKFAITPAKIAVPTAVAGLVYDGAEKTGVEPGTGYTLEGNTATAAGDYTATATLAANYAWEDETLSGPQTVAWSIGKATVAVTAENKTQVYGEAAEALTYTTDPATLIEGNSFSGALAREEGDDVGPYAITQGTLSAGDNYEIDFTGATYTITAAPMTITVAGYNGVYDGAAHEASATTVPDGATVTWSTDGGETWSDTVPSVTGVANVAIVAKATLANYAEATATTSLVVTAKAVALTAASDTKVYDGTALVKDAFTSDGLVEGHTATATVTGSQTIVGASSNVVSAAVIKDAGDNDVTANYNVTYMDGELKVTAATVDIPAAPGNKVYNGQNQTADVTAPATVEVTNDGGKDAGDYTVTFALKDTANYTWSDGSVTNQTFGWSITQKALKLIAEDKEVAHGAAAPAYSYKVDETDGLVEGDSLATEPTLSCAYAAGDAVGTYTIEISGAVAPNYAITYANGTLTVTSNPFTVIWIVDGTQTSSELEWGTVPVFGGSTDKAADGKYAYAFTGWTDGETQYAVGTALPGVTGAVTYTATYAKTIDTPLALAVADEKLDSTAVSAAAKTATVKADLIGAVEGVTVTEASGATVTIDEDTATASFSNLAWNQGVEWTMTAQQTAMDDAQTAESASLPGKFYVKPEAEWFAATAQDLDDIADGSDAAVAYTAPKTSNEGEMVRVHTKIAVPAGGLPAAPATGTAKVGFAVLQLENDTAPAYYAYGNGAWTKLSGAKPTEGDHDYLAVYDLAAETPTARYYIDGVALYAPVDGGSDVYALPLAAGTTSLKSISFASKEMVKDDIVAEQDVSYVAAVDTTPYTEIGEALEAAGTAGEKTLALLKAGVALDPAVSLGSGEKLVVDYAKGTFTNETPVVSGVAGYDVKVTEAETVKTYELDPIVYPIEYVLNGGDNDPSNTNEYTVAILPLALADASRTGYTFGGWTNNVSGNAVATSIPVGTIGAVTNVATWTINSYALTINYLYTNGTVAATQFSSNVVYDTAYSVDSPVIAGYTADKLLVSGTMGAAPVTVDVTYTVNRHTVTFVDEDDTVLKAATEYDYGTLAADIAKPDDPTKAATAEKVYTFAGWTPAIETVTSNAVYTASYTEADTKAAVITVAQDGTTNTIYVATIADAIAAAGNGDTIQLIGDVSGDATIEKNVTIDLNGKTWEGDVSVSGEVKIVDGSDDADGKLDGSVAVANGGSVEVAGGTVDDGITGAGDVVVSGGTVNGGISGSGEIEVSGGTVNGGIVATGEGAVATVKGGTVSGGIAVSGGATGTVTGEDTVVNGDLSGTAETLVVDGGHFEKDPSDYVAEGYYADGDDTNGYDVKERKSLEGAVITVADATYSGSAQAPAPVVKVDDETLELGKDFVAVYATNDLVNADTYDVTIVAIGAWIGSADTTFTIGKAPLSITAENTTVKRGSASLPTFEYDYAGFVNGESAADLATQLSDPVVTNALGEAYSTAARTGDTFVIVPTGATSANYAITFVDGTLTVVAGAIAVVDGTEYEAIADAVAAAGTTADGKVITMLDDADAAVALVPGDVLKIELDGFDVDVAVADAYAARWSLVSDTVEGVTTYTLDEIKAKGLMITEFDFEDAYLVYNTGKAEDLAWDSDKAYCTVVTATDLKATRWNVVGGTSTLHSDLGANQNVKVENLDTSAPVRFFRIAVTPYVLSVDDTVEFAPPAEGGDEP